MRVRPRSTRSRAFAGPSRNGLSGGSLTRYRRITLPPKAALSVDPAPPPDAGSSRVLVLGHLPAKRANKLANRVEVFLALDLGEVAHDLEQSALAVRQLFLVVFETCEEILDRNAQLARYLI